VPPNRVSVVEGSRIIHGGGHQWVVREVTWPGSGDAERVCLVFENEAIVRRVRSFPADWRTYSDESLYSLCLAF